MWALQFALLILTTLAFTGGVWETLRIYNDVKRQVGSPAGKILTWIGCWILWMFFFLCFLWAI